MTTCWLLDCEDEASYWLLNPGQEGGHPVCASCASKLERLMMRDPEARRRMRLESHLSGQASGQQPSESITVAAGTTEILDSRLIY